MLSPKVPSNMVQPIFFNTPSPVKRTLFLSEIKSPSKKSQKKSTKSIRFSSRDVFCSEEEDVKDGDSTPLPFKTYSKRRDSGCAEPSDTLACSSPFPSASTTMTFNSGSSGDENNSDNYFNSPLRASYFRSPTKNFKSRLACSTSPGSSSGISSTSPCHSPPETPPHTQKLRALTLFDTPHTPKTLMSRLRSNNSNGVDKLPPLAASPALEKSKANVEYANGLTVDNTSNQENEDDDFSDVIHRSNVHLPGPRPPVLRTSPLVNINPFTPDNRSTVKRSRPQKKGLVNLRLINRIVLET